MATNSLAQNTESNHYQHLEEKYEILKDSVASLHPLIPAVSSVIIRYHQLEINFFNSLITTNRFRDNNGDLKSLNARETYFYNTLQLTYGISKKDNFNIGIDLNSAMGRIDQDINSSVFKVFNSTVQGNSKYARAVTSISTRVRWRPFKKIYNFTVQASANFPTNLSPSRQIVLGPNRIYLITQLLYNQPLSKRLFLFSQLSFQYGFSNKDVQPISYLPVSTYLSYLLPKKTILFALANYVPIFSKQNSRNYIYTFQLGGGFQYQISQKVLINLYYSNDISGKNYGDFNSYNLSLRFLTKRQ